MTRTAKSTGPFGDTRLGLAPIVMTTSSPWLAIQPSSALAPVQCCSYVFHIDWQGEFSHVSFMITLSLEEAQRSLDSLAERALRGETVFIRVKGAEQMLSLQSVPSELPPNYLAECYGPEEIAEEDYLAGLAPKGLAT